MQDITGCAKKRGRLCHEALLHDSDVEAAHQQLIRAFFQLRAKNVRKIQDTTYFDGVTRNPGASASGYYRCKNKL